MILTETQKRGQKFLQMLTQRAWEDTSFKQSLIANPILTIEQVTGEKFEMPEGKKLVIDDQTNPSNIYLNIPSRPDCDNLELTDEQLELVAGGEGIVLGVVVGLVVLGAGIAAGYYIF